MGTFVVNTDGGGDFLSLALAIAGVPSDLSGGGHTINCEGSAVDSTSFVMSGGSFTNASAANQIKIIGDGIYTSSAQITSGLDHHTFTTVLFKDTLGSVATLDYRNITASSSVVVDRCSFINTNFYAIEMTQLCNAVFNSCFGLDCARFASATVQNNNAVFNNCTMIDCGARGTVRVKLVNCYSGGHPTADYLLPSTGSSSYASEDTTGESGLQNIAINTTQFEDPSTDDYHLAGTGSALFHAGEVVSGLTLDLDGVTYDASTPSLGCFEFPTVAAGNPAYYYARMRRAA